MKIIPLLFSIVFVSALFFSSVRAYSVSYIALNPESEYCVTENFGDDGSGEYRLSVEDPGFPKEPWADLHRAGFTASDSNPVVVPVCFSTHGRRIGQSVFLRFLVETPRRNTTHTYAICVSDEEGFNIADFSDHPCEAVSMNTDIFTLDLLEREIHAVPGETVTMTLLVSSDFETTVSLDRKSGPSMNIDETSVDLPGVRTIDIEIDAPTTPGDHEFTIAGEASDCDFSSCERTVTGVIHVGTPAITGFRTELSPSTASTVGKQAAVFFLSIRNFAEARNFTVTAETDSMLETPFTTRSVSLAADRSTALRIPVTPLSEGSMLHTLKVTVEDGSGAKRTEEATLSVDELVSDASRMAEDDSSLSGDADNFEELYDEGASLSELDDIRVIRDDDTPEPSPAGSPQFLWVAIIFVIVAVAVAAYYIFSKTRVSGESEEGFVQYLF